MEGHDINFATSQNTSTTASMSGTVNWIMPPPDDVPPAGVLARPKPAPGAPPAAVLVLA
jgi:hypothetical protein